MTRLGFCVLLAGTLAVAASAPAQGRHVFVVDAAQSAISYSGTITYSSVSGAVVGQPATFNLSGAIDVDLTVASGVVTTGQFVQGGSLVSAPTLNAIVPSGIPFVPPLASLAVTGAQLYFTSVNPTTELPASFAVGGGGAFNTSVIGTMTGGTATITVLGSPVPVTLIGEQSPPEAISGTIVSTASGLRLTVPVNTTINYMDPTLGASGTLTVTGMVVADTQPLATDTDTISMLTGGVQTLTMSAGTSHAGGIYVVLGSVTGTAPGFTLFGGMLPLNPDGYLVQTAVAPLTTPLVNSIGNLNGLGVGTAAFGWPPLVIPALAGLTFNHAFVIVAGRSITFASNPVPLNLTM